MGLGRPREFEVDRAVDRAMEVFWRKGYEGTSLDDLTKAIGITRPSLYAAFGNKEALFRKSLDRYVEGPSAYVAKALNAPTAREVAELILRGAVELNTNPRHPGCLMVQGALACGGEANAVREELRVRRADGEQAIRERLKQAKADGDLPRDADPGSRTISPIGGLWHRGPGRGRRRPRGFAQDRRHRAARVADPQAGQGPRQAQSDFQSPRNAKPARKDRPC